MSGYRLASIDSAGEPRAGAVAGGVVYEVARLTTNPAYGTVLDVLEHWDDAHPAIERALGTSPDGGRPLTTARLLAPVARPGAIYCIGSNYRDHAEEMRVAAGRAPAPDPRTLGVEPFFFIKSSHAITGPGTTVAVSGYTDKADWELELVAVIGRCARNLSVAEALSCVAGYTIGNDLSARDRSRREQVSLESLFHADWTRHKSFDGSAPMGPWITPAAYLDDPFALAMRLWVNDSIKQDSNSAHMIFSVAEQIASLSTGLTLHPGDLVMTGTPAGVGAGRGEFLRAGDRVRMEIEHIGEMAFSVS